METRRTSSGAGCDTPASAARRKPSRWAGTTRAERGLRVEPQFRRGATPGSGRAAGEPEERHSANNRKEGPVLCRWGWRGAASRGARRRATGAAWHRGCSGFHRARGATLQANDSPPGARGNLQHRPGFAGPTSVGPVARPAACPSSAIPRRPRGKGRTVDREGARASASRSDGGWTPRRGGRGTGGVSDCWETSGSELSPRLGPARIGAGKRRTSSRGGVVRGSCFSAPRIAILPDRETRIRQLETAKARGRGEPSSHYRSGEEAVAADPPPRQAHAP